MKAKNILVALSLLLGLVSLMVGVALIVDRVLKKKDCYEGYIECDCPEDEFTE